MSRSYFSSELMLYVGQFKLKEKYDKIRIVCYFTNVWPLERKLRNASEEGRRWIKSLRCIMGRGGGGVDDTKNYKTFSKIQIFFREISKFQWYNVKYIKFYYCES